MGDPSDLAFGVGEDWSIEGRAVNGQLSLKALRVGEAEPLAPQLLVTDPFFGPYPAAVPEPASLLSGAIGLVALRRRRDLASDALPGRRLAGDL